MVVQVQCPSAEFWQIWLEGMLPAAEQESYALHLETCPDCQTILDGMGAADNEVVHWARMAGDPTQAAVDATITDATLTDVVERLYRHSQFAAVTAEDDEVPELFFLKPAGADRPDLIGMFGEYEVEEVIGQGGMGIVLRAMDPALQRAVALKIMTPVLAGSARARQRFTREAQSTARLTHDNVVTVHRVHEVDGLPYLVMQYIAGESVQARLDREGPLPMEDVVRIGLDTASALAAAHAQNLIHRDIKPANIMLADQGEAVDESGRGCGDTAPIRAMLTDFGLARSVDDTQVTQAGVVAGTPEYMAPEQAGGGPLDARADLFSLGCVLYAMCTDVSPFRAANPLAVLRQVSDFDPPDVRTINPAVPVWLEDLIAKLMAKRPDDRIQRADDVAAIFRAALAHGDLASFVCPAVEPVALASPAEQSLVLDRTLLAPFSQIPSRMAALALAALFSVAIICLVLALFKANTDQPDAPGETSTISAATRWFPAMLTAAMLLTLAGAAAGWLVRQRWETDAFSQEMPADDEALLSFSCAGCGKRFCVQSALAGRRGKCGACGQALHIPEVAAGTTFMAGSASRRVRLAIRLLPAAIGLLLFMFSSILFGEIPTVSHLDIDFRGGKFDHEHLQFTGPDAVTTVLPEDAGLRITLPGDVPRVAPTGFTTQVDLGGDFDIIVAYELLDAATPNHPGQTRSFGIWIPFESARRDSMAFSRTVRALDGDRFTLFRGYDDAQGKRKASHDSAPARGPSGQLKLQRRGQIVECFAAENGATIDRPLFQAKVGAGAVRQVRVAAAGGQAATPFSVRITKFKIASGTDLGQTTVAAVRTARQVGWLALLVGCTLSLALFVWPTKRLLDNASADTKLTSFKRSGRVS